MEVVNKTGVRAAIDVWPIPPGRTQADVNAFIAKERKLAETGQEGLGHPAFFPYSSPDVRVGFDADLLHRGSGYLDKGSHTVICLREFKEANGEGRPSGAAGPLDVEAA